MHWEHTAPEESLFEVKVIKLQPDSEFRVKTQQVCVFGNVYPVPIPFEKVLVSERDPVYCPKAPAKCYTILLERKTLEDARKDGAEMVRRYRKDVEGEE